MKVVWYGIIEVWCGGDYLGHLFFPLAPGAGHLRADHVVEDEAAVPEQIAPAQLEAGWLGVALDETWGDNIETGEDDKDDEDGEDDDIKTSEDDEDDPTVYEVPEEAVEGLPALLGDGGGQAPEHREQELHLHQDRVHLGGGGTCSWRSLVLQSISWFIAHQTECFLPCH